MLLDGNNVPDELKYFWQLVVKANAGNINQVVRLNYPSVSRYKGKRLADYSLFVLWQPLWQTFLPDRRERWTVYWGALPFGSHSGQGFWPGSGFSAFVYANAPRLRAGLPLLLEPPGITLNWARYNANTYDSPLQAAYSISQHRALALPFASRTHKLIYSDDLFNWFDTGFINLPNPFCIARSDLLNKWVIAGAGSFGNCLYHSSDGLHWIQNAMVGTQGFYDIVWSDERGLFCAVGWQFNHAVILTSPDTVVWTKVLDIFDGYFTSVCYNKFHHCFYAIRTTGSTNTYAKSFNGQTWTTGNIGYNEQLNYVAASTLTGYYSAISLTTGGSHTYYSADGQTWVQNNLVSNVYYRQIRWYDELRLFLITGYSATTDHLLTSLDGANWHENSISGLVRPYAQYYDHQNNCLVALANTHFYKTI